MASSAERSLAAEWLAIMVIQTGDYFNTNANEGVIGGALPQPSQFVATMIVFFFLAGMAAVSEKAGRFAAAFGALAALAIAMRPNKNGTPLIVGFFKWLANIEKGIQKPPSYTGGVGGSGVAGAGGAGAGTVPQGAGGPGSSISTGSLGGVVGGGIPISGGLTPGLPVGGPTQIFTPGTNPYPET